MSVGLLIPLVDCTMVLLLSAQGVGRGGGAPATRVAPGSGCTFGGRPGVERGGRAGVERGKERGGRTPVDNDCVMAGGPSKVLCMYREGRMVEGLRVVEGEWYSTG